MSVGNPTAKRQLPFDIHGEKTCGAPINIGKQLHQLMLMAGVNETTEHSATANSVRLRVKRRKREGCGRKRMRKRTQ